MIESQITETKYRFANRMDFNLNDWLKDPKVTRIWFTDRDWLQGQQNRYEVIVARKDL